MRLGLCVRPTTKSWRTGLSIASFWSTTPATTRPRQWRARLPQVQVEVHPRNRGYGGNQKTCYRLALAAGADIVIMIHPDYQYTPALIPAMASLIASGLYPCVLGSRILGGSALRGGMPWWKYFSNRVLTLIENLLLGAKLSEYHSGYRAFARSLLERCLWKKTPTIFFSITRFSLKSSLWVIQSGKSAARPGIFAEASSIGLRASVRYGLGCLRTALRYRGAAQRRQSGIGSIPENHEETGPRRGSINGRARPPGRRPRPLPRRQPLRPSQPKAGRSPSSVSASLPSPGSSLARPSASTSSTTTTISTSTKSPQSTADLL